MENTELLERILTAIKQSNDALRTEILEGQNTLAETLRQEFREALDTRSDVLVERIDRKIKEAETRINIKIENEVDGKLKALFDGYHLNHDQNERQDARLRSLDSRVERLEIRMDILEEHRTA